MKILHLFNQYLPPTENWAYHLISNISGVETHIGARNYIPNQFYDPSFSFAEHTFGDLRKIEWKLNKKNPFDWLRKGMITYLKHWRGGDRGSILRYARQQNIQLIHAHFADVAWYFHSLPFRLNLPFVISFYGWDYERLPYLKPKYKSFYQNLFKQGQLFLCEGENGAEILRKQGCPPDKIKVIRLGIRSDQINFRPVEKKANTLRLVQVATFTAKKGHIYTVKAFAEALKKCPNMTLTLAGGIGDASVDRAVKDYIESNQLENYISCPGPIPYKDLHTYLSDFDVFIHPSCYTKDRDCEGGAPVVLLDAQACGLPVITTRHCDIPDQLIDGGTGFLADENDHIALTKAIEEFYIMDSNTFQEFGIRAREFVEKNFDIRTNASLLKNIYSNLIQNKCGK